jgi:hypothetical protein
MDEGFADDPVAGLQPMADGTEEPDHAQTV